MPRRSQKNPPRPNRNRGVPRGRGALTGLFSFLLLAGLAVLVVTGTGPSRQWAGDALRKAERFEKKVRYRLGLPLRGTPDLARFEKRLADKGLKLGDPVFIRIFKAESELELWMKKDGRFVLFASYPVCRWSGELGPKLKEGDHQAPEGFYTVSQTQLNPNSRWHRSFNLGFPNGYDRAHGRTGSFLMVHGGCGSIGCYAMTNPVIDEIWRLVTAALKGGQPRFQVHIFPFRMTERNMAADRDNEWRDFWRGLKPAHDLFERSRIPPRISVCDGRYVAAPARRGGRDGGANQRDCTVEVSGT